jgi:hypothetical protein
VDAVTVGAALLGLIALWSLAALLVGRVPERKPHTSPNATAGFDIWPFF